MVCFTGLPIVGYKQHRQQEKDGPGWPPGELDLQKQGLNLQTSSLGQDTPLHLGFCLESLVRGRG